MTPEPHESLGGSLRRLRERRGMSVVELARVTRIPAASLQAIEADRFDELPGEVFVRGFLRAYAQAVDVVPDEVLARYTSSRRDVYVTPLPMQTPLQAAREQGGRRFGVAIAFVLLLILLSLAVSIVLKPRVGDLSDPCKPLPSLYPLSPPTSGICLVWPPFEGNSLVNARGPRGDFFAEGLDGTEERTFGAFCSLANILLESLRVS